MEPVSLHKWAIERVFFSVTADHFNEALKALRADMGKMSGEKVNLSLAFYRAAKKPDAEDEPSKPQQLIKKITSAFHVSHGLWRKADYVEARLTTPANGNIPALDVTVTAKWPNRAEILFHAEPRAQGDILGRRFLNETPRFVLWGRSIR